MGIWFCGRGKEHIPEQGAIISNVSEIFAMFLVDPILFADSVIPFVQTVVVPHSEQAQHYPVYQISHE